MRFISLIILITITLAPSFVFAAENVLFYWSGGVPAVTADSTNACTDTAVARFDWSGGQPAVVYDSTANCTAAVAGETATATDDGIIWF